MKNDIENVMDSFKVSIEDAMNALKIGKERPILNLHVKMCRIIGIPRL